MKLNSIGEGFLAQKMREAIRDEEHISLGSRLPMPSSGHDKGSRASGATQQPTGVPLKPRHRKYFNMDTDPVREL